MRQWLAGLGPLFEMIENLPDDDRVFDTGDNFDRAATLLAGFDIDLEYATLSKADVEAFVPCMSETGGDATIGVPHKSVHGTFLSYCSS
jgi:hypothetical protein